MQTNISCCRKKTLCVPSSTFYTFVFCMLITNLKRYIMKKTINTVQRKNENKIMQKNRGEYEEE